MGRRFAISNELHKYHKVLEQTHVLAQLTGADFYLQIDVHLLDLEQRIDKLLSSYLCSDLNWEE
jgi:hypothetical protein